VSGDWRGIGMTRDWDLTLPYHDPGELKVVAVSSSKFGMQRRREIFPAATSHTLGDRNMCRIRMLDLGNFNNQPGGIRSK
jgi:hypothetical protein